MAGKTGGISAKKKPAPYMAKTEKGTVGVAARSKKPLAAGKAKAAAKAAKSAMRAVPNISERLPKSRTAKKVRY